MNARPEEISNIIKEQIKNYKSKIEMAETNMKKLSNINERKVTGIFIMVMLATVLMTCPALAANTSSYDAVVNPVISLLNSLLGPILGLVGAVGTLYCVLLGVKFAKAEEPQEREKAKAHRNHAPANAESRRRGDQRLFVRLQ